MKMQCTQAYYNINIIVLDKAASELVYGHSLPHARALAVAPPKRVADQGVRILNYSSLFHALHGDRGKFRQKNSEIRHASNKTAYIVCTHAPLDFVQVNYSLSSKVHFS